jgi:hypothetical protein
MQLINIIYHDANHDEFMCERIEGMLLTSGTYIRNRCTMTIQQIGPDEFHTRNGTNNISEYIRRFESDSVKR